MAAGNIQRDTQLNVRRREGTPEGRPAAALWTVWSGGQLVNQQLEIGRQPVQLGRGAAEPAKPGWLALDDDRVSREHGIVRYAPLLDLYTVEDCGSTNGLFLNGARIRNAPLTMGDVLRLGDSLLVFSSLPPRRLLDLVPSLPSGLIARSLPMLTILELVRRVAASDLTVLLTGETGCGKEVFAHELHRLSKRVGPFQAVNCGALPENLAESELFGHRKGAFTGAAEDRIGLFRAADRGTLFLDEIGEMPAALQVKLLRVIEEKKIRPVGDSREMSVDVRVMAATNRPLQQAVEHGSFRDDLLARIQEIVLDIPPLRQRREEIPALACAFLERHGGSGRGQRFTTDLMELLLLHRWPHNVRELEKLIRRLVVLWTDREEIGADLLPKALQELTGPRAEISVEPPAESGEVLAEGGPSAEELLALSRHHHGSIAALARHYRRDRGQIYRWLRKHGIELAEFRATGSGEGGGADE